MMSSGDALELVQIRQEPYWFSKVMVVVLLAELWDKVWNLKRTFCDSPSHWTCSSSVQCLFIVWFCLHWESNNSTSFGCWVEELSLSQLFKNKDKIQFYLVTICVRPIPSEIMSCICRGAIKGLGWSWDDSKGPGLTGALKNMTWT